MTRVVLRENSQPEAAHKPLISSIDYRATRLAIAGPEPTAGLACSRPMRIREDNRNMLLLTTVTLCCAVVAGALAVLEPVFGEAAEKQVADSRPIENSAQAQVRVVGGAPFVPNVNPRQH